MAQLDVQYTCIKDALLGSHITQGLLKFNITTILDYFIESHADYKDIRQSSFQMFDKGHVQVNVVQWFKSLDHYSFSLCLHGYYMEQNLVTLYLELHR